MGFSHYNPAERYRNRSKQRTISAFVFLVVSACSFGFGFWLGNGHSERQAGVYKNRNEVLQGSFDILQEEMTQVRAEAQTANSRYEQLQESYEKALPEGSMRHLAALVRTQLEEGIDPERLEFVIRSARPPRNCSDPDTKRFVVDTPAYTGPGSKISIANGAIIITGDGVSAESEQGAPEAWYDPTKPVDLAFTLLGGERETKSGILPLHYSVVVADKEYRFTISEGARSFAKVISDHCDYP